MTLVDQRETFQPRSKLRNAPYLAQVLWRVRPSLPFILDYIGVAKGPRTYSLAGGPRIRTRQALDTSNIGAVFLRKDYGPIRDHMTVIDIGANIGIFSLYAASAGKDVRVYAYEPDPDCYALILHNAKLNGLERQIVAEREGISGRKEIRPLYLAEQAYANSLYLDEGRSIDIPCTTLAGIMERHKIHRCDLLKLDCEGAEFEALYNTPDAYLARIGEIRLEYHDHATQDEAHTIADLLCFLQERGFTIRRLWRETAWTGIAWLQRVG